MWVQYRTKNQHPSPLGLETIATLPILSIFVVCMQMCSLQNACFLQQIPSHLKSTLSNFSGPSRPCPSAFYLPTSPSRVFYLPASPSRVFWSSMTFPRLPKPSRPSRSSHPSQDDVYATITIRTRNLGTSHACAYRLRHRSLLLKLSIKSI